MYYLLTNDVEEISIKKNRLDLNTARLVHKKGLPALLKLYDKYKIKVTFYFTASFVELFPNSVKMVLNSGHEVGCHGLSHKVEEGLDVLTFEQQINSIRKAKEIIEAYAGKIEAFRAPALRINKFTVRVLEINGFKTDSSVASQRFDGPFSYGSKRKLGWLFANRMPYFIDYENPFKKGNSTILEIPISSIILSYIGTTMRIIPNLTKLLRTILLKETKRNGKPVVFDFHPNEVIEENYIGKISHRGGNIMSIFFRDIIRHRFKLRNLGEKAIELMEKEIKAALNANLSFKTMKEFRQIWMEKHENFHHYNG